MTFADKLTTSTMNLTRRITSFVCTNINATEISIPLNLNILISDDPEVFKGAPISLQLVGGTHEEEAVIAMTEIVDKALKDFKAAV